MPLPLFSCLNCFSPFSLFCWFSPFIVWWFWCFFFSWLFSPCDDLFFTFSILKSQCDLYFMPCWTTYILSLCLLSPLLSSAFSDLFFLPLFYMVTTSSLSLSSERTTTFIFCLFSQFSLSYLFVFHHPSFSAANSYCILFLIIPLCITFILSCHPLMPLLVSLTLVISH